MAKFIEVGQFTLKHSANYDITELKILLLLCLVKICMVCVRAYAFTYMCVRVCVIRDKLNEHVVHIYNLKLIVFQHSNSH